MSKLNQECPNCSSLSHSDVEAESDKESQQVTCQPRQLLVPGQALRVSASARLLLRVDLANMVLTLDWRTETRD